jgi:hypothetical protein
MRHDTTNQRDYVTQVAYRSHTEQRGDASSKPFFFLTFTYTLPTKTPLPAPRHDKHVRPHAHLPCTRCLPAPSPIFPRLDTTNTPTHTPIFSRARPHAPSPPTHSRTSTRQTRPPIRPIFPRACTFPHTRPPTCGTPEHSLRYVFLFFVFTLQVQFAGHTSHLNASPLMPE